MNNVERLKILKHLKYLNTEIKHLDAKLTLGDYDKDTDSFNLVINYNGTKSLSHVARLIAIELN